MKRLLKSFALVTFLVGGFFFAQNGVDHITKDAQPSVFSFEFSKDAHPSVFFISLYGR